MFGSSAHEIHLHDFQSPPAVLRPISLHLPGFELERAWLFDKLLGYIGRLSHYNRLKGCRHIIHIKLMILFSKLFD